MSASPPAPHFDNTVTEHLTRIAWASPDTGVLYRVEAVAKGHASLEGSSIVFYSALEKPDLIHAMRFGDWMATMIQRQPL